MSTVLITTSVTLKKWSYFKDENQNCTKKYKNYKFLNTTLESVDTIVIIGVTSTSLTVSFTGIGLIIPPITSGLACTPSMGNKVLHKIIINRHNKYEKQYGKDQQTNKSFGKLYRKFYTLI